MNHNGGLRKLVNFDFIYLLQTQKKKDQYK